MFGKIYPQTRASSGMGMDSSRTARGLPIRPDKKKGSDICGDSDTPPPPHGLDRGGIHPEIGTDHPHPTSGTILPSDRSQSPPHHHRCRPRANAALSLTKSPSASGPGVCVVAVLPIPAGEEVTISYATGPSLSPGGGGPQGQTVPGCRSRILSKMRDVGLLSVGVQIDLLNR